MMPPKTAFSASVEKGNSFFIVFSNAMLIFLKGINFPTQKRLKQGVLN